MRGKLVVGVQIYRADERGEGDCYALRLPQTTVKCEKRTEPGKTVITSFQKNYGLFASKSKRKENENECHAVT